MEIEHLSITLPAAIGILFFLLLASAFFSGSETALTRARRIRLRLLSEEGNHGAGRAYRLMEHPEQMLAAILLGNNFVNIAASSLATAVFVAYFGDAGIIYATIAMTVTVLILAEILPKTLAVAHAEAIACKVATPLQWIMRLLRPIISLLMGVIGIMQRLMKLEKGTDVQLTHRELATIIDMGAEAGVLDTAREQMLLSSLHLHKVPVKSLMIPRKNIVLLDANDTIEACLNRVMSKPFSRYPVFLQDGDNLIGIVHLRDLIKQEPQTRLVDAMIWRDPPYIPAGKNALAQLFDFQTRHEHMAIVVDEYGDIDGLITLEDIVEEIVGEIVDESDLPSLPEMWPQPDGALVVAGTVGLHDINQELDSNLPEEGATTIGGLIVEMIGSQPEAKLCLAIQNVRIEVLSLSGHWIRRVRLEKALPDDDQNETGRGF
ncbi:MAG TPA: CNNM domain-containing protein [Mariprofundaceae bacterium]|nr:CNNM domain-containing protein [Mariprofundaceae bacterium]